MTLAEAAETTGPDRSLDYDVAVIGAGITGIYFAYRLRELGFRFRVFEAGADVGGTWFWNRYPGARFDSESYSYAYSFSEEVIQEWNWSEHFAGQPEILRYLNFVTDKFDLRRDMQFDSRVASAEYDDAARGWTITLDDGSTYTARFIAAAVGPLSAPTLPDIEGIDTYEGEAYQASRWPRHSVSFDGKRVAVIGTGSTGVQIIQEVSKTAAHLTVFQRTPNWCVPLLNSKIDPAEMQRIREGQTEIFDRCADSPSGFLHIPDPRATFEVPEEERIATWERLYNTPGFGLWQGNFRDILTDRAANAAISEFVANKIRSRVEDPVVAEKLIPKNHGFGTKRVPLETNYYEVYNQSNVTLVDITETPVERITPNGIRTSDNDYEFDMIVYATGFVALTGSLERIDIRGLDGRSLKDEWKDGPITYLGIMVHGFPNMFAIAGPHMALGNAPRSLEFGVEWVTNLIDHARRKGVTRIAATAEGTREWDNHVQSVGSNQLSNEIDSWMTGVNKNVKGKHTRVAVRYRGTVPEYRSRCTAVALSGYRELSLD